MVQDLSNCSLFEMDRRSLVGHLSSIHNRALSHAVVFIYSCSCSDAARNIWRSRDNSNDLHQTSTVILKKVRNVVAGPKEGLPSFQRRCRINTTHNPIQQIPRYRKTPRASSSKTNLMEEPLGQFSALSVNSDYRQPPIKAPRRSHTRKIHLLHPC